MNDNNADKAKECICTLRSVSVIIPEKEVRPLIVKTINKDKVGVKRILASNITFMSAMVAATEDEECNNGRIRYHNGLVKTYHPNGNVMQAQVWKNDRLIHITTYYENGNIESDINVLDSDDNGNVIKDGASKFYYKSGKLAKEYYYKKDVFEGIQTDYNEDGYLELKTTYKNGQLDGLIKFYHKNGQLETEINYINGKAEGTYKIYYTDGSLEEEGTYKNDQLDGEIRQFDNSGKIVSIVNYKNGELIK